MPTELIENSAVPVTKKKKLCSEVQIWFGREHVPIFLVQVGICQYSTKFTFEVSSLYIAPEESRFHCNASLIMPMNYCPCNDWGSNSAPAAALKLFRSVIKSWISYGVSLKCAPALAMISQLQPLHNCFMHRTQFLSSLNTQLDFKPPAGNFKLDGTF